MPVPALSPVEPALQAELAAIHCLYSALLARCPQWRDSPLGGMLLYAGELSPSSSRLLRAANIAGTASLTASADPELLRQANREGTVDFLVTTLDEALRILKNEIRKHQPVSVAVSRESSAVLADILDRGVLPDLLPPASPSQPGSQAEPAQFAQFIAHGALRLQPTPLPAGITFKVVQVPAAFAQEAAKFDALLLGALPVDDHANRHWIRLSPRYLSPQFRRLRSVACDEQAAHRILNLLEALPQPSRADGS